MKVQRWEIPLQGACYMPEECDDGEWCESDDVARLEASHADLLEALRALTAVVGKTQKAYLCCASQDTVTNSSALQEAYDLAHAAIADAEGQEEQQ